MINRFANTRLFIGSILAAIAAGCAGSGQSPNQQLPGVGVLPAARDVGPARQLGANRVRYVLVDLGTFGGPASYFMNGLDGILNEAGTASGWADTSTPDPFPMFCFNPDCYVSHAFRWRNGQVTDLGALPGGGSSSAIWISPNSLSAGDSQNGQTDPLKSGFPETHSVLFRGSSIVDLGTLEGGYQSATGANNNRGQVGGLAFNTVYDPYSIAGGSFYPYESRAFLWQHGKMRDLGTLGTGNDAIAFFVNEPGQVAGISYTNTTPNLTTGVPTADPFVWTNGDMDDLGTLGGTFGFPNAFNDRGDAAGMSNLAGDTTFHPFLWTRARGIRDLGTLGGDTGIVNWLNDQGEIAGKADLAGPNPQRHDAYLWRNGKMIDLGTLPGDGCSNAYFVNAHGQVVGTSENKTICGHGQHAFLWKRGGPMVNLNTLISARDHARLHLVFAFAINDSGVIAGTGVPPDVSVKDIGIKGHAYILIPCNGDRSAPSGCNERAIGVDVPSQSDDAGVVPSVSQRTQPGGLAALRAELVRRFHFSGAATRSGQPTGASTGTGG